MLKHDFRARLENDETKEKIQVLANETVAAGIPRYSDSELLWNSQQLHDVEW